MKKSMMCKNMIAGAFLSAAAGFLTMPVQAADVAATAPDSRVKSACCNPIQTVYNFSTCI